MRKGRQICSQFPPLNCSPDVIPDCASYAARRSGPGVMALLNQRSVVRNAFGNWKNFTITRQEGSDMADNYTEHKLQISFKAKFLVAEAIRRTIAAQKSVNFSWGEVAKIAPQADSILAEASSLCKDFVLDHRESDFSKLGLSVNLSAAEFLQDDPPPKRSKLSSLQQKPSAAEEDEPADGVSILPIADSEVDFTEGEEEGTEAAASSSSESGGSDEEEECLNQLLHYEELSLVTGVSKGAAIHVVAEKDDPSTQRVSTMCKASPRRDTAIFAQLNKMRGMSRSVCNNCAVDWPIDILRSLR